MDDVSWLQSVFVFYLLLFLSSVAMSVAYLFGWNPPPWVTQFSWAHYTPPRFLVGLGLLGVTSFLAWRVGVFSFDFFQDQSKSDFPNAFVFLIGTLWAAIITRTLFLFTQAIRENFGEIFRGGVAITLIAVGVFVVAYFFQIPILDFFLDSNEIMP